jgi:hypothetical protein
MVGNLKRNGLFPKSRINEAYNAGFTLKIFNKSQKINNVPQSEIRIFLRNVIDKSKATVCNNTTAANRQQAIPTRFLIMTCKNK